MRSAPLHATQARAPAAAVREHAPAASGDLPVTDNAVATVLGLQRTAGNRAVVQLLERDRQTPPRRKARPADRPGPAQGVDAALGFNFAFFFTGGDAFGQAAERYVKQYYPDHRQLAATSFEDMFAKLDAEVTTLADAQGGRIHVDEIIIVSHANSAGGMKIALTGSDRKRRFNPWEVTALQQETKRGLHQRFMKTRERGLRGIDSETRITVRGCEIGKSKDAMEALRVMFGGQPYVVAPTAFQGFSIERIGSAAPRLKTPEMAFDMLVKNGYLGPDMATLPDDEKRAYIKDHFGDSVPTEFFLVGEDDYKGFKALSGPEKLSEGGERFKQRPDDPTIMDASKVFSDPRYAGSWGVRQRDPSLDNVPKADLAARAEQLFARYTPADAGLFLRIYEAWTLSQDDVPALREAPLTRTPAVFSDENLERARQDVFKNPALGPDAFKTQQLAYTKPQAGADASDFRRSEEQAGVLDTGRGSVASGVDEIDADHMRLWGYATASTDLTVDMVTALRAFAAGAAEDDRIVITGHTDSTGSPARNLAVSRDRARAVADVLVEAGVSRDRITPSGAGPKTLLERETRGTAGDLARAHNRRVEVVRTRPKTFVEAPVHPDDAISVQPTVQRDRWGVGPKRTRGIVELLGKDPLDGMRLSKFAVGIKDPDANHKRGLRTIAHDYNLVVRKLDKRRVVIAGHAAKGEPAGLGEERAEAVAKFLRDNNVPAANIIDVAGYGHRQPLDKVAGGPLDRRVDIKLTKAIDYVDPKNDVSGGGDTGKRVGRDAPTETPGMPTPDDVSKGDIAQGLTLEVLGGLGLEALTLPASPILAGFVAWLGALANIEAARVGKMKIAYRDGLVRGSGNCWTEAFNGKSTYPYDTIWPRVVKQAQWAQYIPADPWEAERAMSTGTKSAVDVWDKTIEDAEHRTRRAVYDKLNKAGRSAVKEGDKVYNDVIRDIRREVAKQLHAHIELAAKKI